MRHASQTVSWITAALVLGAACTSTAAPPTASPTPTGTPVSIGIYGTITDIDSGAPVEGLCVTVGRPGAACWATTDRNGNYYINGTGVIQPSATEWELYFAKSGEYAPQPSGRFKLTGGMVHVDAAIRRNR